MYQNTQHVDPGCNLDMMQMRFLSSTIGTPSYPRATYGLGNGALSEKGRSDAQHSYLERSMFLSGNEFDNDHRDVIVAITLISQLDEPLSALLRFKLLNQGAYFIIGYHMPETIGA